VLRRQIELSLQERDDLEWLAEFLRNHTAIPSLAFFTITSIDEIIARFDKAENESG
jgi:hypothetical protein